MNSIRSKPFDTLSPLLTTVVNYFQKFFNVTSSENYVLPSFSYCSGIPVRPFTKKIDFYLILEGENSPLVDWTFSGGACKVS